MSSCQYGSVQPPCSNPPSRSSSLPPGACITPSRVTNSETISFLIWASLVRVDSLAHTGDERASRKSTRRDAVCRCLPDPHPVRRREVEGLARLHRERVVPGIQVADGERAEGGGSVAVGEEEPAEQRLAEPGAPRLGVAQEE